MGRCHRVEVVRRKRGCRDRCVGDRAGRSNGRRAESALQRSPFSDDGPRAELRDGLTVHINSQHPVQDEVDVGCRLALGREYSSNRKLSDPGGFAHQNRIFAVPLLTIYANVVGMLGGFVVAALLSDVTLLQYYIQTTTAVTLGDWVGGLFKASVYGVIIAIAGCLRGMQSKKSAAAVGNAATSAVVTAIVFIIVAEAVLTVIYTVLGV